MTDLHTRHLSTDTQAPFHITAFRILQTGSCYCWRPAEWLMEPFILPPWDHHKCSSIIQPSSELQAPPGRQLGDVVTLSLSLPCTDQIQPQKSWSSRKAEWKRIQHKSTRIFHWQWLLYLNSLLTTNTFK